MKPIYLHTLADFQARLGHSLHESMEEAASQEVQPQEVRAQGLEEAG